MARNTHNWMENPANFETSHTRHVVGQLLFMVVVMVIGCASPCVWSQENISPQEKPNSANQTVTEDGTPAAQDLKTQPTTQPTTQTNESSTNSSSGTRLEKIQPTAEPITPPPSSGASSAPAPTMQNTAADGTVSIVIQPDTQSPPPPAEFTRPPNPIEPQNPSVVNSSETGTSPDKTAATLLLERILEPLEFSEASSRIA